MSELLPSWPLLSAFIAASLVLAITPGPGVLFIITCSLVQGRRAGLLSVYGVAFGNFCNACIATAGLAALLAASAQAYSLVKYVGAGYLIYLGCKMLLARVPTTTTLRPELSSSKRMFFDGFVVALFNPKTTLFYVAFLPQFLGADAPLVQGIVLSAIFVGIAAFTDSGYALAAGWLAPLLQRGGVGKVGRWLGGSMFIGLGILAGARK